METKPWHRRLGDFESFDKITFEVVPRYKTSGLSGDEWRQHIAVKFWFKGEVVHESGFRDMQAALMCAPREWLTAQEPIPDRVIEIEKTTCDQPGCERVAEGRFRLKRIYARGHLLDGSDAYNAGPYYRQFCKKHVRRGDCSREDSDDNYEALDGTGPDDSTNLEESPLVMGPVIHVTMDEDA